MVRRPAGVGLLAGLSATALVVVATTEDARPNERPPHPEPRVIVNVLSVQGPHARPEVERSARHGWGRIVSCYNAHGQRTKGLLELELVLSADGRVSSARRTRSTLKIRELTSCLMHAVRKLPMPKAGARSTAVAEIHVAPGDPG